MSEVFIIRHGNTFDRGDIVTRVGARTDLPLSASGQRQADALARHFAALKLRAVYAACSPLQRTAQTLAPILSATSSAAEAQTLPFLTEVDYGPDENQPEADVVARIGAPALELWDREAVLPDGWHLNTAQLIRDWQEFFRKAQDRRGASLIVTSNGIARFIFQALSIAPGEHPLKLRTGAYGQLTFNDGQWSLIEWDRRPEI